MKKIYIILFIILFYVSSYALTSNYFVGLNVCVDTGTSVQCGKCIHVNDRFIFIDQERYQYVNKSDLKHHIFAFPWKTLKHVETVK